MWSAMPQVTFCLWRLSLEFTKSDHMPSMSLHVSLQNSPVVSIYPNGKLFVQKIKKNKGNRFNNLDFKLSNFLHIFLPIFSSNFSLFQPFLHQKVTCFLTQHAMIPFVGENSKNCGFGLSLLTKRTLIKLSLTHNKTTFRLPLAFSPKKDDGCGDCRH